MRSNKRRNATTTTTTKTTNTNQETTMNTKQSIWARATAWVKGAFRSVKSFTVRIGQRITASFKSAVKTVKPVVQRTWAKVVNAYRTVMANSVVKAMFHYVRLCLFINLIGGFIVALFIAPLVTVGLATMAIIAMVLFASGLEYLAKHPNLVTNFIYAVIDVVAQSIWTVLQVLQGIALVMGIVAMPFVIVLHVAAIALLVQFQKQKTAFETAAEAETFGVCKACAVWATGMDGLCDTCRELQEDADDADSVPFAPAPNSPSTATAR